MKEFIKQNWFKIVILVIAFTYISILFLNFYLDAKRYNLSVYKDGIKFCYDLTGSDKAGLLICRNAIKRYYLNPDFFINDDLQKDYERERAFWVCHNNEWKKDKTWGEEKEERISKYCSEEADKILK